MKTVPYLFLALACYAAAASAQSLETPYSELLPERQYTVTITKSIAGNDGFKEMLPRTTTQTVIIETGALASGSLPVMFSVYPTHSADAQGSMDATARPEWSLLFSLNSNLDVRDIVSKSSEGDVPPVVLRSILMRQLGPILFHTRIAVERKPPVSVEVVTVAPAPDRPAATALTYKLHYQAPDTPQEPTAIVSSGGTALYDTAEQFYIERRLEERSEMYVGDTGVGTEQRVIRMDETTVFKTGIMKTEK